MCQQTRFFTRHKLKQFPKMKGPIFCGRRDKSILEHETIQMLQGCFLIHISKQLDDWFKKKLQNKNFHKFVTNQEPY